MSKNYDFKKEWPKIKGELLRIKKETMVLAKKGEKEIKRFSVQGKMHLDITALKLKKEHLFHLVGKEYVKAKPAADGQSPQLKKLLGELDNIDKEIKTLNRKIKSTSSGAKNKK